VQSVRKKMSQRCLSQISRIFTDKIIDTIKEQNMYIDIDELTYAIRGAIYKVHRTLGPGLFESVYEAALMYELSEIGLKAVSQVDVPVNYNGVHLEVGFRMDILVENAVIVEIKSIETLNAVHKKQLLTYLKLSGKTIGFLVNFNVDSLVAKESFIRIIN
jgi:GxxExxY protein